MPNTAASAKRWNLRPKAPVLDLGRSDIPTIISQILHNRGITTPGCLDAFLKPSLAFPSDAFLLPGIRPAVDRIVEAHKHGESVGIFGDFDVDGITGTAIVAQGLEDLGIKVFPYIPDRFTEGHGLNTDAVRIMKEMGVSVLITVDCGVSSVDEVAFAQDLGIDVIITDHHTHQSSFPMPNALAIVDPKLDGPPVPFSDFSGGGLAFKLLQGLYEKMGREPSFNICELAALSTVADLVPLRGENRYIVQQGLTQLRSTARLGLQALYQRAGIKPGSISAETIGFSIAPRLNAAGRLDHGSASYRLLVTTSAEEADSLANQLEQLNRNRQRLTAEAWSRAQTHMLGQSSVPALIMVMDDDISPGISGLVASRLVDRFHRPSVVLSRAENVLRASARSVPGFNIAEALACCDSLLLRHGGHSMAAGFEVAPDNLPALEDKLQLVAQAKMAGQELEPCLEIDAEVPIVGMVGEPYKWLSALEPFGMDNRMPVLLSRNLQPVYVRTMGVHDQHLKLRLKEDRVTWDAIAFDQADRWVPGAEMIDVAYNLSTERRGDGQVIAIKVLDFRPSNPSGVAS